MRIFMKAVLILLLCGLSPALAQEMVPSSAVSTNQQSPEDVAPVAAEPMVTEDSDLEEEFYGFDDDEDFTNGDLNALDIYDPIEPFNRGMFWVNDKLYFYLFKPVARGLRVVPEPARQSVSNFFSNLSTPVRFVNALLQFKLSDAGTELSRLVVNSTVGIGGLFDPARKYLDLHKKDEDLGQTFGHYGVGNGFYIVWPLFGPSTARDTVGMAGDYFLDPMYYIEMKQWERISLKALDREVALSLDKDTYEAMKRQALDPYLYVRSSYAQYRTGKIKK